MLGYAAITSFFLLSVFTWKIFPVCFIAGVGLTPFKKVSEYVICLILSVDIALLFKNRESFDRNIFRLLLVSFIFTIGSELAFTFYIDNYGFSNLVGHYFKFYSFFLLCAAMVASGIREPYAMIFKELSEKNEELNKENFQRKHAEFELEKTIAELNTTLQQVKTLSGLIPICASCKKIRDDKGYWQQIESYIHAHSDAEFSHGICPGCAKALYPQFYKE